MRSIDDFLKQDTQFRCRAADPTVDVQALFLDGLKLLNLLIVQELFFRLLESARV